MTKFAIALCADEKYFPYACCVAEDIANQSSSTFDILIYKTGHFEPKYLPNNARITVKAFDECQIASTAQTSGRISKAAYTRIYIPGLLQGIYDKILYVDADIYVRGDLSELFNIDTGEHPLAAVRDKCQWAQMNKNVVDFKINGLPASPYFNSGVLLIDVEKYIRQEVKERCEDMLDNGQVKLPQHDQSLLNIVLKNNWMEISPVWNCQPKWQTQFICDFIDWKILHFVGPDKPWNDKNSNLPAFYRRHIQSYVLKNFDGNILSGKLTGRKWPSKFKHSLFHHFVFAGKFKSYLMKFEGDGIIK